MGDTLGTPHPDDPYHIPNRSGFDPSGRMVPAKWKETRTVGDDEYNNMQYLPERDPATTQFTTGTSPEGSNHSRGYLSYAQKARDAYGRSGSSDEPGGANRLEDALWGGRTLEHRAQMDAKDAAWGKRESQQGDTHHSPEASLRGDQGDSSNDSVNNMSKMAGFSYKDSSGRTVWATYSDPGDLP
jgi:hypothetical protein